MKKFLAILLPVLLLASCTIKDVPNNNQPEGSRGNELFDLSSLEGKEFYEYYLGDDGQKSELRIPDKDLPYTYERPEEIQPYSYANFTKVYVADSKLYISHLQTDFNDDDHTVTYTYETKEINLLILNNKYYWGTDSLDEAVFSSDLILLGGDLYATRDYAVKEHATIYTIDSQHEEWKEQTILSELTRDRIEEIDSCLSQLSEDKLEISLPTKVKRDLLGVQYNAEIEYKSVFSISGNFELEGSTLMCKSFTESHLFLEFSVTVGTQKVTVARYYYYFNIDN